MKENLLKLFQQRQYLKLIDELKLSNDVEEIWLVIDCYIKLGDYDNAISALENNREILFSDNPRKTMTINISLFLDLKDYVHALKALSYYEELPYVSMDVEETLSDLKNLIYQKMDEKEKKYNDKDVFKMLDEYQNNLEAFMRALFLIRESQNFDMYVPKLKKILVSDEIDDMTKTLVLILFVEKKYMGSIKMIKEGMEYDVVPYNIDPIPSKEEIDEILNESLDEKDVTILKTLNNMIAYLAISIYPNELNLYEDKEALYALYAIVYEMCGRDIKEVYKLARSQSLNLEIVKTLIIEYKNRLQNRSN